MDFETLAALIFGSIMGIILAVLQNTASEYRKKLHALEAEHAALREAFGEQAAERDEEDR